MRKLAAVIWIVLYLAVIDILINVLIPYPNDPRNARPTLLESYFEYGRSIEGKLERMTKEENSQSAPIITAGWLDGDYYGSFPQKPGENAGCTYVAIYGMSHAKLLGEAIAKVDPTYIIREMGAPGGVPSRSYSAYLADRRRGANVDVAILGVMTDSVPLTLTTSGATAYFDLCYPYTYPRYRMNRYRLERTDPPFQDLEAYRHFLFTPGKWAEYRDWLRRNDKFYDPLLFEKTFLDRSSLIRAFRRTYAEITRSSRMSEVYSDKGFNEKREEAMILKAMVRDFAAQTRSDNVIPVIYIVNNQGRGDHLFKLLEPTLQLYNVPFLSTHIICPPENPGVFIARDTHFIPSKDLELAHEMIRIIEVAKKESQKSGLSKR